MPVPKAAVTERIKMTRMDRVRRFNDSLLQFKGNKKPGPCQPRTRCENSQGTQHSAAAAGRKMQDNRKRSTSISLFRAALLHQESDLCDHVRVAKFVKN